MLHEPEALMPVQFFPPDRVAATIASGPVALFLDVDGTLLPIRRLPTDVCSDPPLRLLLEALAVHCRGALALVSGRAILDLDRIFAPLVLPAAGLHGAEIRHADLLRHAVSPDLVDVVRPAVRDLVAAHSGLLLEDKGLTLAVHFRQRPELEADVVAALTALVVGHDLSVQRGKMVAEVKPAAIDKGRAIANLMAQAPFANRCPVFFGDDRTDESGFRYVNDAGGVSVRVGPLTEDTVATVRVPDVAAVLASLAALCSHV